MVSRLNTRHALTDRFDDTSAFVTEDNGESAFGVFAGEGVGICSQSVSLFIYNFTRRKDTHTGMADTSVVDLNAHFMCLGWRNLDVLDGEVLAGFPGNCCL
jgi:hypothetical protein